MTLRETWKKWLKGDLHVGVDGIGSKLLVVGSNGQHIEAASGEDGGLVWRSKHESNITLVALASAHAF